MSDNNEDPIHGQYAEDDGEWRLVLAFDTDDAEFARGFECGSLWRELCHGDHEMPLRTQVRAGNAEMVMRMCEALGLPFRAEDVNDDYVEVFVG